MKNSGFPEKLSFDGHDEIINPPPDTCDFDRVIESALNRRGFLGGVIQFGVGSFIASSVPLIGSAARASGDRFGFRQVEANTQDTITVPEGFEWYPLVLWGDPLWSDGAAFDEATRGSAASQARAFGDNNDGMEVFTRGGRVVIAVNNEYTTGKIIWGNRSRIESVTRDDREKAMMAHGLSLVEIVHKDRSWRVVKDSPFNRRITPRTEMILTGPAAGHDLLKTAADPTGTRTLGTWNNCGSGRTPWGSYLTCEENFNFYFSATDPNYRVSSSLKRYGVSGREWWGYGWATLEERFDVSKHPNEPNRAGYVVEIDPFDPHGMPKKLTALGRFKHENAACFLATNGHVVVYMGDDERGEFLYRFVSERPYSANGNNADLLEKGMLYVAKFDDKMRGKWIPLTPVTVGMGQAEICIHTREAASKVGATTMDRPEWVAVNPTKTEVCVALTNNKNRGIKPNAGGDPTPPNGPNPRSENHYGQIVQWMPDEGDHTAEGFRWQLFALAGNPAAHQDAFAGSSNINAGNMFNAPDGLAFDDTGLLWIQTDGKYTNEGDFAGMGNNQMLAGDTATGEIRRFLVGPKEAEITGLTWSPDRRTMFVGIQHPGEQGNSHFPRGGSSVPRSGVFAVRRSDGDRIG